MMRRTLVILVGALFIALGFQGTAHAFPLNCFPSTSTVPQGSSFTVSGETSGPGEFVIALLDGGVQIGSGLSGTGAGPFLFSFVATIPATTSANVTHTLSTRSGGVTTPCSSNILVTQAAAPVPPATATPTASPAATVNPALIDVLADRIADRVGARVADAIAAAFPRPAAPPAAIPAACCAVSGGGGAKLPKTGVDAAEFGGLGTLSLATGISLMEFARRRRRNWIDPAPATASEAIAYTTATPADAAVGGEADLLLPYDAATETVAAPPAPSPDPLTPSF